MLAKKTNQLFTSYFFVTISISIVLYVLGAFVFLVVNADEVSNDFKENIPLTIYLKESAKKIEINQLQKKISLKNYTKSTEFISKEQGAELLIKEIEEDFLEFLGTNPILNSIDIYLKAEFVKSDVLYNIDNEFSKNEIVDEVRYDSPLVSLLNENLKKIKIGILVIASFFLTISILIINNSIRLSIYSDRMLIKTMQLVGATKSFIRKPFIKTHVNLGIVGSIIAIIFLYLSVIYLEKNVDEIYFLFDFKIIILLFVSLILFSIVITFICTFLATQKFLKSKIEQLY
ncbi:MAG: cell division protein FtsX [Flavobacteriaceae bacterium]|nr:cell division protein FtsX [Flavobacteriaceae bacterium]